MTIKLYNTLTRVKEEFVPIEKDKVKLYTCGPTVYNFVHIGNLRTYVFQDILRRYLRFRGLTVRQVMNLTDVDDKTIRDSIKEGTSLSEFTKRYSNAFIADLNTLNIEHPEVMCSATKHIKEMIDLIKKLMDKGIAYKGTDDSIYFNIAKYKEYGKLSKVDLSQLKAGARVSHDEYEKESLADFALWKAWDNNDGDVFWETELGKGRPGWHIECSAMSMKYLGEHFDIHTGGVDLRFPHHENEIAQSEAASEKKFANYWLHAEHLLVNGKKMSKSLGNFYTLRDILKKIKNPMAIRYLLLSTNYRQQLNFTFESLEGAENSLERMKNFMIKLNESIEEDNTLDRNDYVETLLNELKDKFIDSMDDDLNICEALASIFNFINEINKIVELPSIDAKEILERFQHLDHVLGVLHEDEIVLDDEIDSLLKQREEARKVKNFEEADIIRKRIENAGYVIEDTGKGARVKRKSKNYTKSL